MMQTLRPEILQVLLSGRWQVLKNQITKRGRWGIVVVVGLAVLFIGLQFSVGILSGSALREFREVDGSALWGFLLFFTSVVALIIPFRSPQSFYPKDLQFRFLKISDAEWYLADWVDRLSQGSFLFPLSLFLGLAITWFPTSQLPVSMVILIAWTLLLPIISRLVVSLLSRFTSSPSARRYLMFTFFFLYFGLIFWIGDDQSSVNRIEGLTANWISRPVVSILLEPSLAGVLILLAGFTGFLFLDWMAFRSLSGQTETLSTPAIGDKAARKKTDLSNPWIAILFRHPSFGILLVMLPVITYISQQEFYRLDAIQRVLSADPRMFLVVFSTGFWTYGLGMLGGFGIHHLTSKTAMFHLIRPVKLLQMLTVGIYLLIVFLWDWIELAGTVFSGFLFMKVLAGTAFAMLVADLLLVLNPWLYPRFPAQMKKVVRTSGTMIFNVILIAGIFLTVILQELIVTLGPGHPAELAVILISGGYLLLSFTGMPALISGWWIRQSETFISHYMEGS